MVLDLGLPSRLSETTAIEKELPELANEISKELKEFQSPDADFATPDVLLKLLREAWKKTSMAALLVSENYFRSFWTARGSDQPNIDSSCSRCQFFDIDTIEFRNVSTKNRLSLLGG